MEKRINEIVNRLNRTKEERKVDFEAEKMARISVEKKQRKDEINRRKAQEEEERRIKQEQEELKSYGSIFKTASMSSNRFDDPVDAKRFEEDFF